MYIGSANSDWRSLTQVKEMGVYIQDCPCMAKDLGKIFDVSISNNSLMNNINKTFFVF